ncbi:MAG: DUF3576 domain-containing protein [Alphaproteobacteria bacterium]|nr:DUF3576 domain-containing protein [Alphaproteobacteria bacterium]
MPTSYHRLMICCAASLFLLLVGCTAARTTQSDAAVAQLPQPIQQEASAAEEMDTETTIWNILGIAKKMPRYVGPQTGPGVSPILWQAALDTLNFAAIDSMDPVAGLAVTKWYAPKGKPDQRLRITVFVKARALRSDSLVVTVDRQTRTPGGWQDAPVAAAVAENLENDILERARQIHIARLREEQ